MDNSSHLFTSESVTEGHPDKLCDQISDAVLDAHLARDPNARVACETLCAGDMVTVAGEISSTDPLSAEEIEQVARETIRRVGYTQSGQDYWGFSADSCEVRMALSTQSPDIAQGVDDAYEHRVEHDDDPLDLLGAGDQGLMFGYACSETPQRMPLAITLAHALTRRLAEVRKNGTLPYLRPDGKAQVTLRYEGDQPVGIDTIIVSTQHHADATQEQIAADVAEQVVMPVLNEHLGRLRMIRGRGYAGSTLQVNPTADEVAAEHARVQAILDDPERMRLEMTRPRPLIRLLVNPTGKFVIGGPVGDAGLTGRKIIVDTYGGAARHGGGAFSGKDATKVDRSAAYAARHVARNIVAARLADRCEVQVAYAIGVAHPVSVMVDTFGTGGVRDRLGFGDMLQSLSDEQIAAAVQQVFDLRPAAIIERLDLRQPRYQKLAAYGHVGRDDLDLPWEREDHVEQLRAALVRSRAE